MMQLCDGRYNGESHKTICFDEPLSQCPACYPLLEKKYNEIQSLNDELEDKNIKIEIANDRILELEDILQEMEKTLDNK